MILPAQTQLLQVWDDKLCHGIVCCDLRCSEVSAKQAHLECEEHPEQRDCLFVQLSGTCRKQRLAEFTLETSYPPRRIIHLSINSKNNLIRLDIVRWLHNGCFGVEEPSCENIETSPSRVET